MKHAGLDISDDAIHCVEYGGTLHNMTVTKHIALDLPSGLIEDGDIKNEGAASKLLSDFDKSSDLSYVKVSVPEEKAYLFQTDVPDGDMHSIEQNIEFKLEENVPLSAADAVFYFDLLPAPLSGVSRRASVSVVPRSYIERLIVLLRGAGIFPVSFETVPKAIARAIVAPHDDRTILVVHMMKRKTGVYVISGGVVCFTSTLPSGTDAAGEGSPAYTETLSREVNRVYAYWISHNGAAAGIREIILLGKDAAAHEESLSNVVSGADVPVSVVDAWRAIFDLEQYVPPITRDEFLEYAVAAGLALPF